MMESLPNPEEKAIKVKKKTHNKYVYHLFYIFVKFMVLTVVLKKSSSYGWQRSTREAKLK